MFFKYYRQHVLHTVIDIHIITVSFCLSQFVDWEPIDLFQNGEICSSLVGSVMTITMNSFKLT